MIPDTVSHYEELVARGESVYFDPVELDEIYHYYVETNEIGKVEEVLRLALSLHPDDMLVKQMDAEFALNCGDTQEALDKLNAIFSEDHPYHCILKSAAMAKLGRQAEAFELAELALVDEDPKEYVSYDLGLGFMNAAQYTTALHYFERSLQHHPDDAKSMSGILYCKLQLGETEGLMDLAEKILQLDPFNYEAWLTKGNVFLGEEKYADALDAYEYATAIAPDEPDPFVLKARVCDATGQKEEAIGYMREAADKAFDDQRASILLIMAGMLEETGKHDEAVSACWSSLEGRDMTAEGYMQTAHVFSDIKADNEALQMMLYAQEKAPDDLMVLMPLAEKLNLNGDHIEAAAIYQHMADIQPQAGTFALWAGALMSQGKYNEALKKLKKSIELDEMWQTYILMAACDIELKHFKKMEEHFRFAYSLCPDEAADLMDKVTPGIVEQMKQNGFLDKLAIDREKWIRQHEDELRLLGEKRKTDLKLLLDLENDDEQNTE